MFGCVLENTPENNFKWLSSEMQWKTGGGWRPMVEINGHGQWQRPKVNSDGKDWPTTVVVAGDWRWLVARDIRGGTGWMANSGGWRLGWWVLGEVENGLGMRNVNQFPP